MIQIVPRFPLLVSTLAPWGLEGTLSWESGCPSACSGFVVTFRMAAPGRGRCLRQACLSEGRSSGWGARTQCPLSPLGQKGSLLRSGDSGSGRRGGDVCGLHIPHPIPPYSSGLARGWGRGSGEGPFLLRLLPCLPVRLGPSGSSPPGRPFTEPTAHTSKPLSAQI